MNTKLEELKAAVTAWIEDVDDALSDNPGGYDANMRVGARWWYHDEKIRTALKDD